MKLAERIHRIVATRIKQLARIQEVAQEAFERTDDKRMLVRRMEVAGWVSAQLGLRFGRRVCEDVRAAVEPLGWESIDLCGRAYYRCVKPKALTSDEALKRSREDIERGRYGVK